MLFCRARPEKYKDPSRSNAHLALGVIVTGGLHSAEDELHDFISQLKFSGLCGTE